MGHDWNGDWTTFFEQNKTDAINHLESNHAEEGILGWWHDVRDHERAEVNLTTEWIGYEDVDFWDWLWLWYFDLERLWTYDHPAEDMDTSSWLWLQDTTRGFNDVADAIIIDFDDSD